MVCEIFPDALRIREEAMFCRASEYFGMRLYRLGLVSFSLQPQQVRCNGSGLFPRGKCPGLFSGGPGGIRTHDLRRVRATSVLCDLLLTRLDYRPIESPSPAMSREKLVVYSIFDKTRKGQLIS